MLTLQKWHLSQFQHKTPQYNEACNKDIDSNGFNVPLDIITLSFYWEHATNVREHKKIVDTKNKKIKIKQVISETFLPKEKDYTLY